MSCAVACLTSLGRYDSYSAGLTHADFRSQADEQTVFYYPDYVIQFIRQGFRIVDGAKCTVQNIVTAIAPERFAAGFFAEKRVCAQAAEPASRGLPTEGNDFYGNGLANAKAVNDFGLVDHNNQPPARISHNLFPQQRAAVTFDQIQAARFDLVRAVNRNVYLRVLGQG